MEEEDKKPEQKKKILTLMDSISLSLEFGFVIALPLVVFGSLGKWLDSRYNTKVFLLIGILFAITSTILWLYKRLKDIVNRMKS